MVKSVVKSVAKSVPNFVTQFVAKFMSKSMSTFVANFVAKSVAIFCCQLPEGKEINKQSKRTQTTRVFTDSQYDR